LRGLAVVGSNWCTIDRLFAIVVLFSWACVHNNPSAGPVLAGSTGWSPT